MKRGRRGFQWWLWCGGRRYDGEVVVAERIGRWGSSKKKKKKSQGREKSIRKEFSIYPLYH